MKLRVSDTESKFKKPRTFNVSTALHLKSMSLQWKQMGPSQVVQRSSFFPDKFSVALDAVFYFLWLFLRLWCTSGFLQDNNTFVLRTYSELPLSLEHLFHFISFTYCILVSRIRSSFSTRILSRPACDASPLNLGTHTGKYTSNSVIYAI